MEKETQIEKASTLLDNAYFNLREASRLFRLAGEKDLCEKIAKILLKLNELEEDF